MLPMIELPREGSRTTTGFKTRLAILAAALVGCAPAARAQEQVPLGEYIFVHPGFKPETVSLSLQESCFGTQFRFAIVNRPPPGRRRSRQTFPGGCPQRPFPGNQVRLCR